MAKGEYVRISKVLNNNAIEIRNGRETFVVLGTGAGFRRRPGDLIQLGESDKVYALMSGGDRSRFEMLLAEIPFDCFELTQRIVAMAERELKTTLNESLVLSLADHIYFAAMNCKKGNQGAGFDNEEIKRLYEAEYQAALKALEMVNRHYDIRLDRKEAISIAFLIVGAEYRIDRGKIERIQRGIDDIIDIVDRELGTDVERDPVRYSRLVIHLKFFLQGVLNGDRHDDDDFVGVSLGTKGKDSEAVNRILAGIEAYMLGEFDYRLTESERFYLLIHIVRIM